MKKVIDWQGAFNSIAFKKAKNNRLKFVIPLLTFFTLVFYACFPCKAFFQI